MANHTIPPTSSDKSQPTEPPNNCVGIDGVDGVFYCVGRVPMRKQVCLFRETGTLIEVIAYFPEPDEAEAFRAWLIRLCRAANEAAG